MAAPIPMTTSWRKEFQVLTQLALPTILQTAAQQAMIVTDQIFLGRLGTDELAAAALGNTYQNLLWYFLLGTSTALDTLGAQAYGAGNHAALVTVTITSGVVLSVLCSVAAVGLAFGEPAALHLFAQQPQAAQLMGTFCKGLIPGLWPLMGSVVLSKFMMTQNLMMTPAIVTLVTFLLNIAGNFVFIRLMGFKGAPLATSCSRLIQFIMMAIAVAIYERLKWKKQPLGSAPDINNSSGANGIDSDRTRLLHGGSSIPDAASCQDRAVGCSSDMPGGASSSLLQRCHLLAVHAWRVSLHQLRLALHPSVLWKFVMIGLPGGLMMSFEAGSFDVTTIMAGQLGPAITAAHSAMLSVIYLTFLSCPFAVATAVSIRVGNVLGAGRPKIAKKSAYIAIGIGSTFMAMCAIAILAARNAIGRIFSHDHAVISTIAAICPMAAMFQVSDGVMGTSQGVLRGAGKQHLLMLFNMLGFWLCGVLLGYLLCFKHHMGVTGLWWGIASGDTVAAILNMIALAMVRWDDEAHKAQAHVAALDYHTGDILPGTGSTAPRELELLLPGSCRNSHRDHGSNSHGSSSSARNSLHAQDRAANTGGIYTIDDSGCTLHEHSSDQQHSQHSLVDNYGSTEQQPLLLVASVAAATMHGAAVAVAISPA